MCGALDAANEVQRVAKETKHHEDEQKKFILIPMPKPG
jgi:hypothetical protein